MQRIASPVVIIIITIISLELSTRVLCHYFLVFDIEMLRYSTSLKDYSDDNLISFEHRKKKKETLMGVDVSINSKGLRDKELKEDEGDKKIIFLGDSLTFGWGVEKDKVFEDIVEKKLWSYGKRVPILNYGHCNFNTEQQVDLLLKKENLSDIDSVFLFYFINDAEKTPIKKKPPFYSQSLFISLLRSRYNRITGEGNYYDYYIKLYDENQSGWIQTQNSIKKLHQSLKKKGVLLYVFLLPDLHQVSPYPFYKIHKQVSTFLSREGVEWDDLTSEFKDVKNSKSLWVALDDPHPNEKAHKIIAEGVFSKIKERLRD